MQSQEPESPNSDDKILDETPEKADIERQGPQPDDVQRSIFQDVILILLLSTAQFCTQVGVGRPLAILHVIGDDLKVEDPAKLSWLMAAFSLTVGTFILPSGRMGDVFCHKIMLMIGFSWFAVWTMVAGLAVFAKQGYLLFVLARALQGIGPAICLPNALALLGREYGKSKQKNMIFATFGATAPLGSVAGAATASLWAEYVWWPWSFWSFAIVLGVTAVLIWIWVPPCKDDTHKPSSKKQIFIEIDLPGSFTGVLAMVLFNFAWNQAPVSGWGSPAVITTLIVSLLVTPLFFYIEKRSGNPILPIACLNGQMGAMLACIGLGWSCFGIFLYYTWQFFEQLRHASPLLATAWYSTNGVSGALAAILTGFYLERVGARFAMIFAMLAYAIGTVFIATAPVQQTYWANSFLCLLIVPFGMDISFPAGTVMVSDSLPPERQGMGASLVNTVVNYSISLGLGVAGTVEGHVNGNGKGAGNLLHGFRGAWYTGVGLSSLGLAVAVWHWMRHFKDG